MIFVNRIRFRLLVFQKNRTASPAYCAALSKLFGIRCRIWYTWIFQKQLRNLHVLWKNSFSFWRFRRESQIVFPLLSTIRTLPIPEIHRQILTEVCIRCNILRASVSVRSHQTRFMLSIQTEIIESLTLSNLIGKHSTWKRLCFR